MFGDEDRKILLETIVFRPLYVHYRKCFDYPKTTSTSDDMNGNNPASFDMIAAGRNNAARTSFTSHIFQKLKGIYVDENMDFEKWITLKGMKMAFFSQTLLGVMRKAISAELNQQNIGSLPVSYVNDGLRKCLMKSMFSGAVMAVNIGCIMTSITQFAVWREYFSLWTVPCATIIIPTLFSYPLGVKPKQAMKGGLILGVLSSLAIFSVSVFYNLSIDETYQYIKSYIEVGLKKERESELYRFMKEHNIRSKLFGKWMLNRSRTDENIDDELS